MKTWVLLVVAAMVFACSGRPQMPPSEVEKPPEQDVEPAAVPANANQPAEESQPLQAAPVEEARTPEPVESPESVSGFVVTEEVYNRTFEEVEEFIRNLNDIIRRRDYESWLTYLSSEYIRRTADEQYLQEQSEKPLLKKNNIRLESLRDYFENVVAPSRSQASVDDIEFIDEDRVKVISSIRGTRGILYLLVREEGTWKIGVWD
jgi:hypothetical protein